MYKTIMVVTGRLGMMGGIFCNFGCDDDFFGIDRMQRGARAQLDLIRQMFDKWPTMCKKGMIEIKDEKKKISNFQFERQSDCEFLLQDWESGRCSKISTRFQVTKNKAVIVTSNAIPTAAIDTSRKEFEMTLTTQTATATAHAPWASLVIEKARSTELGFARLMVVKSVPIMVKTPFRRSLKQVTFTRSMASRGNSEMYMPRYIQGQSSMC